jgi:hypothetical protein
MKPICFGLLAVAIVFAFGWAIVGYAAGDFAWPITIYLNPSPGASAGRVIGLVFAVPLALWAFAFGASETE